MIKKLLSTPGIRIGIALAFGCGTAFAQQAPTALREFNANNTSATSAVNGSSQSAADTRFGSVSKVSIHTLLGSKSSTHIYAHLMPWFGTKGHIDVGYDSADRNQVKRQIDDMVSRGIDGVIVYWTGASKTGNAAHATDVAMKVRKEAEQHSGFQFAIQEDKQALKECAKERCDVTATLIGDLQYAAKNFFGSRAYMSMNGRPLLFFFGLEEYKNSIDWNVVRAAVPGNPLFVFRNSVGFDYPQSDGAFAWNVIDKADPNDVGLGYLDHFYKVAAQHVGAVSLGSAYPGFDDQLAAWFRHRLINRNCGDTWLKTLDEAKRHVDAFMGLQLVTWNDYEEGSHIEPGIDNCVSVQASVSTDTLQWTITGSEATIHHFAVWVSTDKINYREVQELPASNRGIALSGLGLDAGQYYFVVQAIGQPSMLNHISAPVSAKLPSPSS